MNKATGNMTFSIRPEDGVEDRKFIRDLNTRLVEVSDAPTHCTEEVEDFQDRFTASAWGTITENRATFVAVAQNDQKIGYINVRESEGDIASKKCAYIALLAVTAEAEGKGVAQSLIAEAEAWSKQMGYSRICLDVFDSNDRGQKFDEQAGFQPETIRMIKKL